MIKLNDKTYKGFFLLQFEKTNPEDGKITLINLSDINKKRKIITPEQLIKFLKFEWPIL